MSNIIADYATWHHHQVRTGDIDPAYPVLAGLGAQIGRQESAWLILRYVAYYHMGSALRSYAESPGAYLDRRLLTLPTGTERRGHRSPAAFATHWADLNRAVERSGGPAEFLTPSATGHAGWQELTPQLLAVHGNGRWAAYKTCEMAQKVLGVDIAAPDAGHAYSTGPRKGLALLGQIPTGNSTADIAVLDEMTTTLAQQLGESDIAQVETTLCDFHSAYRGRYYIGKDIDEQLHQITTVPSDFTASVLSERRHAFPHAYLGEIHGWSGPDKDRQKIYRNTGRIVTRNGERVSDWRKLT